MDLLEPCLIERLLPILPVEKIKKNQKKGKKAASSSTQASFYRHDKKRSIWIVDDFMSQNESKSWKDYVELLDFEKLDSPASRDYAFSKHERISFDSIEVAQSIFQRVKSFCPPKSGSVAVGCSPNIRIYRYSS